MKRLLLTILVLLAAPLWAGAQDQPVAPSPPAPTPVEPAPADPWASYPAREADRPMLPAVNGYLMGIGFESFSATRKFDDTGRQIALHDPISVFNLNFDLQYGISKSWALEVGLPYTTAKTNEYSAGSVGNIYGGLRASLIANDRVQFGAGLQVSAPTGDAEYHYHRENGEVVPENYRTGNPGWDLMPEILFRGKVDNNLSLRLRAFYSFTGPGETVLNQISGVDEKKTVNPGDGWGLDAEALLQVSPRWAIPVGLNYYQLGESELKGYDFNDQRQALEARAGVLFQVNSAFDLILTARLPITGQNVYLAYPVGLELRSRF